MTDGLKRERRGLGYRLVDRLNMNTSTSSGPLFKLRLPTPEDQKGYQLQSRRSSVANSVAAPAMELPVAQMVI